MSRRVEALYEVLKQACKDQYGFAPERISENLQYLGTVGAKDPVASMTTEPDASAVHCFRDHVFGAEIHLSMNPVVATLFEHSHMTKQGWPERLQTEYCKTDVQIKAERDARDAKVKYTLESPLWASVGQFVRTQFPGHETSDEGAIAAIGLHRLVEELAGKGDPEFLAFAEHIGGKSVEELSWVLEMAYRSEFELAVWEKVKAHPNIKAIDGFLDDLIAGNRSAHSKVKDLAYAVCDSVPEYQECSVDNELIITLVMRNRVANPPAPAPAEDSPAP